MSGKKKRKKMRGSVSKVIRSFHPMEPDKAQIDIHEADPLYREVRVENELADEDGGKARLKPGDEVDIVIEATGDASSNKPAEKKHRH